MRPEILIPRLKFRYYVEFLDYPDYKFPMFTGNRVVLPKWTIKDGWKNEISFRFYNFELKPAIENVLIDNIVQKPSGNRIRINLLYPDGETKTGYWDVFGDIEVVDFGDVDWSLDDTMQVYLKMMPSNCEYTNLIKDTNE